VTLLGDDMVTLEAGDNWVDSGAEWIDSTDGSGTISTASSGSVNIFVPGTYTLEYWYTDSIGVKSNIVTRTVTVEKTTRDFITTWETFNNGWSCTNCVVIPTA